MDTTFFIFIRSNISLEIPLTEIIFDEAKTEFIYLVRLTASTQFKRDSMHNLFYLILYDNI